MLGVYCEAQPVQEGLMSGKGVDLCPAGCGIPKESGGLWNRILALVDSFAATLLKTNLPAHKN